MDVALTLKVGPDSSGSARASGQTFIERGRKWGTPGYSLDEHTKKITSFRGKFEWRSTFVIRTIYEPGVDPNDFSCYGRGTTPHDVSAGDTSVGFHESCHRQDLETYLKNHPIPLPTIRVGMTEVQFKNALTDFENALDQYIVDAGKATIKATDEVGAWKRSQWEKSSKIVAKRKCFDH
jgi:hypothetical protein